MDAKTKAKQEILQEIIAMMDKSMSDGLASKSPKMAMPATEEKPEAMDAMASEEMPEESPEMGEEEMSEDDIEKLKELHASLK